MKHLKSAIVGIGVAALVSLFYLVFYSQTIQISGGLFGGAILVEQPLIQPPLVVVFITAFTLGFFFMARSRRASN